MWHSYNRRSQRDHPRHHVPEADPRRHLDPQMRALLDRLDEIPYRPAPLSTAQPKTPDLACVTFLRVCPKN